MHTSNLYYVCVDIYMMKSHGVICHLYINKIKMFFLNKSSFLFPNLEMVTFL